MSKKTKTPRKINAAMQASINAGAEQKVGTTAYMGQDPKYVMKEHIGIVRLAGVPYVNIDKLPK